MSACPPTDALQLAVLAGAAEDISKAASAAIAVALLAWQDAQTDTYMRINENKIGSECKSQHLRN